jgi:hypothetical protein
MLTLLLPGAAALDIGVKADVRSVVDVGEYMIHWRSRWEHPVGDRRVVSPIAGSVALLADYYTTAPQTTKCCRQKRGYGKAARSLACVAPSRHHLGVQRRPKLAVAMLNDAVLNPGFTGNQALR